ncbi:MAG TPA: response regulator transcription factor [Gemmatimonadaceae bacterium]|jgi:DNA-binding response OmpR family regulator|nr:response regulator transcription factor [Gemmatimonadaceae bacterium]
MRILVVDDDSTMTLLVRKLLEEEGYAVDTAVDGESARLLALVNDYDAVVLDLMLPDGNSIPMIRELRTKGKDTPVVVLTGTTDKAVTVQALDAGADDYLTKPIVFDEFKARMRALVRRGGARRTEQITVGNVVLNRLTREVLVNGTPIRVTPRELSLLEHLLIHTGEVVARTELLERVFDLNFDPGTNVVDVTVGRLRRKLREARASVAIQARRGLGFVLAQGDA